MQTKADALAMNLEDAITLLETYVTMAREESLDTGDNLSGLRTKQMRVFALMAGAQTQIAELKRASNVAHTIARTAS